MLTASTRRSFLACAAASALSLSAQASIFPWHIRHKHRLSNPHASPRARKLYSYLWGIYGRKTLTGQQVSAWSGPRSELDYLQRTTGKQPAILGLDYINPAKWTFVNDRATRWYLEEGGIPRSGLAVSILTRTLLQCAAAGYAGMNLHSGGDGYYTPIAVGPQLSTELRPLYFGMQFAGYFSGADLYPAELNPASNASAYFARHGRESFLALINKGKGGLMVELPKAYAGKSQPINTG